MPFMPTVFQIRQQNCILAQVIHEVFDPMYVWMINAWELDQDQFTTSQADWQHQSAG
jgi:hypothetical protein